MILNFKICFVHRSIRKFERWELIFPRIVVDTLQIILSHFSFQNSAHQQHLIVRSFHPHLNPMSKYK